MDEYQKRLRMLKLASESVKRRTDIYSEISDIDNRNTAKSMSALRNAPDPGGKMQKVGFIIFWIPEPTGITNAIGAPMILAGKYLEKRYNGSTLHDIGKTTKNHAHTISNFKDAVF
ncbi:MAG TPA: hypothetical protein VLF17_01790 [Candidatus Nitrosotenuis sp.]|nr:hypothetical protein [Candidatus Nitrosotenuis sp.]